MNDHNDRFPPTGNPPFWVSMQVGGGDSDPKYWPAAKFSPGKDRPLSQYCRTPETFHCTADAGMDVVPGWPAGKSLFSDLGNSYYYNAFPWWEVTKQAQADPFNGIAEKPVAWVPDPAHFVLMSEPPAIPYHDNAFGGWTIWHYRRGPGSVHSPKQITAKVVSPILFVDGHSKVVDRTKAVKSAWPAEPTDDCIWYKPLK